MIAKRRKIKKSGKFKKILFPFLAGIFLFGFIGFLVVSNLRIKGKRSELIGRIEEIKEEISFLEERNEQLKAGIIQTAESEAYWEARVREQGYKKPGEEVVVVLPPAEEEAEEIEKEKNILEKWLEFIGL